MLTALVVMAADAPGTSHNLYSIREVSDILELSSSRIRALVADGAITPTIGARGKFLFSFQDLVLLRSVGDLIRSGVSTRNVRAAIAMLRGQLPDDISLTEVSLGASGTDVVVRVDATAWEPLSGQTVLDLDTGAVADRIALVADAPEPVGTRHTAAQWFVFADGVESSDPAAAADAYRRALEIDDDFADAHLNLGRLLHAAGSPSDALEHYQAAEALDPDDPTTHYNMGVAYQDLGRKDDATAAYERAIELAPRFADALYNLASLFEEIGDEALAIQHLRAYRDVVEGR